MKTPMLGGDGASVKGKGWSSGFGQAWDVGLRVANPTYGSWGVGLRFANPTYLIAIRSDP